MNNFLKSTILGVLVFVLGACGETVNQSDSLRLRETELPDVGREGELRYDIDSQRLKSWTDARADWRGIGLDDHKMYNDLDGSRLNLYNVNGINSTSLGGDPVTPALAQFGSLIFTFPTIINLTNASAGLHRNSEFDWNGDTPGDSTTYTEVTIVEDDFIIHFDNSREGSSNVFTVSAAADGINGTQGLMWQENLQSGEDFIISSTRIRLRGSAGTGSNNIDIDKFKVSGLLEIKTSLTAHALGTIVEGDISFQYRIGSGNLGFGTNIRADIDHFGGNWYLDQGNAPEGNIDSGVSRLDPIIFEIERNDDLDIFRLKDPTTKAVLVQTTSKALRSSSKNRVSLDLFSNHFYAVAPTNTQPTVFFFDDLHYEIIRDDETITLDIAPTAANPTDTILADFGGTVDDITITLTPNDGTNNGATPVDFTISDLDELVNTGAIAGKTVTLTDTNSVRVLNTSFLFAPNATILVDGGEGDGLVATFGVNGVGNRESSVARDATDGTFLVAGSQFGSGDIFGSDSTADSLDVTLGSGPNHGTGDSGDVTLAPGSVGSGALGKILLLDGSEGTPGNVWLEGAVSGEGSWAASPFVPLADADLNMAANDITNVGVGSLLSLTGASGLVASTGPLLLTATAGAVTLSSGGVISVDNDIQGVSGFNISTSAGPLVVESDTQVSIKSTDLILTEVGAATITHDGNTLNIASDTAVSLNSTVLLVDGSQGTASHLWTSTDTVGSGNWEELSITNIEASATADTSTTSTTYVVMNSMTNTPAAGTYLVMFSSSGSSSSTNADLNYAIFDNGVVVQHTERDLDFMASADDEATIYTQGIVVTAGGEAIDVRFKTSAGTFNVNDRSLIFIKVD